MQYSEKTISYKTYLKTAMVEAFRAVFGNHRDKLLKRTKVGIEFPLDQASYPALIVKFFERDIQNAGIGHVEFINHLPVKHYLYHGDIEFSIKGLSSLDRDLLSDTIVQTLTMGELQSYTNNFFRRIYANEIKYPLAATNFININTDQVMGFGETAVPAPWGPEDQLVYETAYRTNVFGEFYSPFPTITPTIIERVDMFPYLQDVEDVPTGREDDPAPWEPEFE